MTLSAVARTSQLLSNALSSSNPATALNPFTSGAPGTPQLLSSLMIPLRQRVLTFDRPNGERPGHLARTAIAAPPAGALTGRDWQGVQPGKARFIFLRHPRRNILHRNTTRYSAKRAFHCWREVSRHQGRSVWQPRSRAAMTTPVIMAGRPPGRADSCGGRPNALFPGWLWAVLPGPAIDSNLGARKRLTVQSWRP